MPGYHSPLSPSGAHRYRPCPASIREQEGLPDTAGEEAIQGTVFHDYAADCLELGLMPHGLVGDKYLCEDGKYRPFTQEMADKMVHGLKLMWAVADEPGGQLFVEKRVSLDRWLGPDESGTSDAFNINILAKQLVTFDWKWGAGVPVSPVENDQGILYTLGVWNDYAEEAFEAAGVAPEDVEVKIIIEQPRAPGGGGVWVTDMATLLEVGEKIKVDAERTRDPNAPHNPGEKQCQFCRAAFWNTCKARSEYIADLLSVAFDDLAEDFTDETPIELVEARALTPAQRSRIVLNTALIKKWLDSLQQEAMKDATDGRPTPGLKRVPGRASARAWKDNEKAQIILQRTLGRAAWETKLLSPTKAEEAVGKKRYREDLEGMVASSEAKPILVPISDARDPIPNQHELLDEALAEETLKPEDLI